METVEKTKPKELDKETLKKNIVTDIEIAIYFLNMLRECPEAIDAVTDKFHDIYVKGGSLIDLVAKNRQEDGD